MVVISGVIYPEVARSGARIPVSLVSRRKILTTEWSDLIAECVDAGRDPMSRTISPQQDPFSPNRMWLESSGSCIEKQGHDRFAAFVAIRDWLYLRALRRRAPACRQWIRRQVVSVIVISGDQRIDLGASAAGESRKVDVVPGKPLQVDYTFDEHITRVSPEPLAALQAMTVSSD
jgi:hypothetical protein